MREPVEKRHQVKDHRWMKVWETNSKDLHSFSNTPAQRQEAPNIPHWLLLCICDLTQSSHTCKSVILSYSKFTQWHGRHGSEIMLICVFVFVYGNDSAVLFPEMWHTGSPPDLHFIPPQLYKCCLYCFENSPFNIILVSTQICSSALLRTFPRKLFQNSSQVNRRSGTSFMITFEVSDSYILSCDPGILTNV